MKIIELHPGPAFNSNIKLNAAYLQFDKLLKALRKRELPAEIIWSINKDMEEVNAIPASDNNMK